MQSDTVNKQILYRMETMQKTAVATARKSSGVGG